MNSDAGFRVFEVLRDYPGEILIGGQLLHISIDAASGVVVRAVGVWPDLLGQKMDQKAKLRRVGA